MQYPGTGQASSVIKKHRGSDHVFPYSFAKINLNNLEKTMLEHTNESHAVKAIAGIIMVVMLLVAFVLSPNAALAGIIDGECDDTINDPGKGRQVLYHTNHYKFLHGCVRQSGDRVEDLPSLSGKECASPRVDGCSLGESKYLFTERDQTLMKAACNEHDLCYSTYGTTKLECDGNLGANLRSLKDKHQGGYSVEAVVGAVLIFGDHEAGQDWGKENNCRK